MAPESAGSRGANAVRLRIATTARADIEDLLAWSEQRFGVTARQRYESLLICALLDIAEDAARQGVRARPELGTDIFSYHLYFSRKRTAERAGGDTGRVLRPRHFLIGRIAEPGFVDILRVLHDAMELSRHRPDDSR